MNAQNYMLFHMKGYSRQEKQKSVGDTCKNDSVSHAVVMLMPYVL